MTAIKIKVWECTCERCGHRWIARNEKLPMTCARCRSPYWNRKRKEKEEK